MIEVRYAGVVVGRSAIVRDLDTRGLFLGITEPMPVGTQVVLRIGDPDGAKDTGKDVAGTVEAVAESQELTQAGMRVRLQDPKMAALFGTPGEAPRQPIAVAAPAAIVATASRAAAVPVRPGADEGARAPAAAVHAAPSGPLPVVVDMSGTVPSDGEGAGTAKDEDADPSASEAGDADRIPAPDPSAFASGGGGKKGRRNRRR